MMLTNIFKKSFLFVLSIFFVFSAIKYVENFNNNATAWAPEDTPFYLSSIGGYGANGYFYEPRAIALDVNGNMYIADSFNSRVQKLDSSGNYVMKFGTFGSSPGQLTNPSSIAVDSNGNIYVLDGDGISYPRLQKFNSAGNFVQQIATVNGLVNGGTTRSIAVDPSDNVYITDYAGHQIKKYDTNGSFVQTFGQFSQSPFPNGITIDSSGNIYTLNNGSSVSKFNSSGVFQYTFGSTGVGDGQFTNAQGIAVNSSSGDIYVVDPYAFRIQRFSNAGAFISKAGSIGTGNTNFLYPMKPIIDSSGNILIPDSFNNRIQKFSSTLSYIATYGVPTTTNGQFYGVGGYAQDSLGNMYITDYSNGRVEKFNSSGQYVSSFGSYGTGNGQFQGARSIVIDASNNIYVSDSELNRFQKFDSAGNFIYSVGTTGSGNGQFNGIFALALDSSGNIYATDRTNYRVQKFDSAGNYLSKFGTQGVADNQFSTLGPIYVEASGNIYVGDNNYIKMFNSSGTFISKFGGSGSGNGQFQNIHGLDVDSLGNFYVSDGTRNDVQKFDSAGSFLMKFGGEANTGTEDGKFVGYVNYALYIDGSDNIYVGDQARVQYFVFDRFGPAISIDNIPNDELTTNIFTGSAWDFNDLSPISSVKFQLDSEVGLWTDCTAGDGNFDEKSENFTCTIPLPVTLGYHIIYVQSTDGKTNTSTTNYELTIVDTTAPTGSIVINSGDTASLDNNLTLSIAATDNLVAVTQMLISDDLNFTDANWEAYGVSKAFSVTEGDGVKTVYIKFKDAADNTSSTYSDTIILDTTGPTGQVNINDGGHSTNTQTVTLTLSATDANLSVTQMIICNVNTFFNCSYGAYTTETTWNIEGVEGTQTVYVMFKDSLGNESTIYSDTIVYDIQGPTGTISINNGASATKDADVMLYLTETDDFSNAAEVLLCNNSNISNCSYTGYSSEMAWTLDTESTGVKTVYVRFKDLAGNVSILYSDSIIYDTTGPKIVTDTDLPTSTTTKSQLIHGLVTDINPNTFELTNSATPSYVGNGTNKGWNSNDNSWKYNFTEGFQFPFYNNVYTSTYISSNGRICFNSLNSDKNGEITDTDCGPFIAPMWTDLGQGNNTDKIKVSQDSDKLRVSWRDSFQNIIPLSGLTSTGVAQNWNADEGAWTYNLPFSFNFYGTNYSNLRISPNGTAVFGNSGNSNWYKMDWSSITNSPNNIMAAASGVMYGKIYYAGGNSDGTKQTALRIYDPETNTWDTSKSSMTTARNSPTGAVIDGQFYVVGGLLNSSTASTKLEVYDPNTDTWRTRAPMLTGRIGASGDVYNDKLYIVGGSNQTCSTEGVGLEVYDPVENSWEVKASPPIDYVQSSSGKFLNGKFYLVGGQKNCNDPFSNAVVAYDPNTDSWTTKANLPANRAGGSTVVYDGKLIYIGGSNDYYDSTINTYSYDPDTDEWSLGFDLPDELTRMVAEVVNDKLYIIGGKNLNWNSVDEGYVRNLMPFDIDNVTNLPFVAIVGRDLKTDGVATPGEDIYITETADEVTIKWIAEDVVTNTPVAFELTLKSDNTIRYNFGDQPTSFITSSVVGTSNGLGTKETQSRHYGKLNTDNVGSVMFTYSSNNYVEEYVNSNSSTSEDFKVEAVLYNDGRIEFNYPNSYDFNQIYMMQSPLVGISKGDGTNYNVISDTNSVFNTTSIKKYTYTPQTEINIASVTYKLNQDSYRNCIADNAPFNTSTEEFTCSVDLEFGNNIITLKSLDSLGNTSTEILDTINYALIEEENNQDNGNSSEENNKDQGNEVRNNNNGEVPIVPTDQQPVETPSDNNINGETSDYNLESIRDFFVNIEKSIVKGIKNLPKTASEVYTTVTSPKFSQKAQEAGLVTGVIATAAQEAISGVSLITQTTSLLNLPIILGQFLNNVLVLLGLKKKGKDFGYVYNSITKAPIPLAIIRFYDSLGTLITTSVTNTYGVFESDVNTGTLKLTVDKNGYTFPSKVVMTSTDNQISNVYHGDIIDLNNGDISNISIPLDPIESSTKLHIFKNIFKSLFNFISKALFVLGFAYSVKVLSFENTVYNIIIVVVYAIILIFLTNSWIKSSKTGKVTLNGKTIQGVKVGIILKKIDKIVDIRFTDEKGKYKFVITPGEYEIRVLDEKYNESSSIIPTTIVRGTKPKLVFRDIKLT